MGRSVPSCDAYRWLPANLNVYRSEAFMPNRFVLLSSCFVTLASSPSVRAGLLNLLCGAGNVWPGCGRREIRYTGRTRQAT
jgi:hypothetical protein